MWREKIRDHFPNTVLWNNIYLLHAFQQSLLTCTRTLDLDNGIKQKDVSSMISLLPAVLQLCPQDKCTHESSLYSMLCHCLLEFSCWRFFLCIVIRSSFCQRQLKCSRTARMLPYMSIVTDEYRVRHDTSLSYVYSNRCENVLLQYV